MKSVKNLRNLKNKRVLVRVDFNVPLKNKKVVDNSRLCEHIDTINWLIKKQAKIILLAHLGRPDGKVIASMKLDPVAKELSKLLGKTVKKINSASYKNIANVRKRLSRIRGGQVVLLDNIRFSKDEAQNTGTLAEDLASLADIFVLDGFGVAHRPAASVMGIPQYIPSYAGPLLQKEIKTLNKLITHPKKPFIAILGGAKLKTKIPVMKSFASVADKILIGGAIANTYFKAAGYRVGDSLVEPSLKKEALMYGKKRNVMLPVDLIVGTPDGKHYRHVEVKKNPHQLCKKGEAIFDIGPKTIQLFAKQIKAAETLMWNGSLGLVEQEPYHMGTLAIARLMAARSKGHAFGVVGGGDTLKSIHRISAQNDIDFISTGGGAMLHLLAGKKLPGIEALTK